VRVTPATVLVLQALLDGRQHGFDIMAVTGLASGTVYPILRRIEAEGVARAKWEAVTAARDAQRPPRRYYELTSGGARVAREMTTAAAERRRTMRAIRPVEG
jgi:PadR family transcriptional regulator, regulatory protein PadR